MNHDGSWNLTKSEQEMYINDLTENLASLRAKIGISQGDLATLIGVSRQTYSSIETGSRPMLWGTYLSLLFFFYCNSVSRKMLKDSGIFPKELLETFNYGEPLSVMDGLAGIPEEITEKLDKAAYQSIRTVVMLEYARCTQLPGEAVVKSFDGVSFREPQHNEKVAKALKAIKESRQKNDEQ